VKLDREVELARGNVLEKGGPGGEVGLTFGQCRVARKRDERIEQVGEASDELACPGEPDECDLRLRGGAAKGSQRGYCHQQVAKLERTEDRDSLMRYKRSSWLHHAGGPFFLFLLEAVASA
jgi:hypothetical protein